MVDRNLAGVAVDELAAAIQQRAIDWSSRYQSEGRNVRYIRTTVVPGESHCMCLFEAPSPDLVAQLNYEAQIPYTRVTEVLDLPQATAPRGRAVLGIARGGPRSGKPDLSLRR